MSKLVDTSNWKIKVKEGGRAIKELMGQRDVAQSDLSSATGIPKSVISRYWGGGTMKPAFQDVVKIYGSFGLTPDRAAMDFGLFTPARDRIIDPRGEEMLALVREFEGDDREEFINTLLTTAHVFAQRHRKAS